MHEPAGVLRCEEQPEPAALGGFHPPIVAQAVAPIVIFEPPFGGDPFRPGGAGGGEGHGPPAEPCGRGGAGRGDRLGRKETQGARGVKPALRSAEGGGGDQEPVAWHGPIVMNTQEELRQALRELNDGTFIKHG